MALYEGLKDPSKAPAPPVRAWKELRHERSGSRPSGAFLDDLLGQGSRAKISQALGAPAKAAPPKAPAKGLRVEALGSGQSAVPRGKKGVGRAALLVIALALGLVRLHPLARLQGALHAPRVATPVVHPEEASSAGWSQDLASLFHASSDEDRAKEALKRTAEAQEKEAQDQVHLAALPVDPAGGTALALWQDGSGKWWQVNAKAELRPCSGPNDKDSLGLPELRGVAAEASEHGQGKRLSLKLPAGLLSELLPLQPSVASEVKVLQLDDPAQPALLTYDGTRCLLDPSDWERRQRRLGLVLADLAAKKRRASVIDLRYEDTAVVRPAGRV